MTRVELTSHLYQFFPDLEGLRLEVEGASVREVVGELVVRDRGESWITVAQILPPIYSVRFG